MLIKVCCSLLLVLFEQNDKGQCPVDVVPEPLDMPLEMADAAAQAKELRTLLRDVLPQPITPRPLLLGQPLDLHSEKARAHLASMGIRLGDKVIIAGQKVPFSLMILFVTINKQPKRVCSYFQVIIQFINRGLIMLAVTQNC